MNTLIKPPCCNGEHIPLSKAQITYMQTSAFENDTLCKTQEYVVLDIDCSLMYEETFIQCIPISQFNCTTDILRRACYESIIQGYKKATILGANFWVKRVEIWVTSLTEEEANLLSCSDDKLERMARYDDYAHDYEVSVQVLGETIAASKRCIKYIGIIESSTILNERVRGHYHYYMTDDLEEYVERKNIDGIKQAAQTLSCTAHEVLSRLRVPRMFKVNSLKELNITEFKTLYTKDKMYEAAVNHLKEIEGSEKYTNYVYRVLDIRKISIEQAKYDNPDLESNLYLLYDTDINNCTYVWYATYYGLQGKTKLTVVGTDEVKAVCCCARYLYNMDNR